MGGYRYRFCSSQSATHTTSSTLSTLTSTRRKRGVNTSRKGCVGSVTVEWNEGGRKLAREVRSHAACAGHT